MNMPITCFKPSCKRTVLTTRNFGGTGLGLALSRQLARALGGDVSLEQSEQGKGSVFVVDIEAQPLADSSFIDALDFSIKKKTKNFPKKGDERLKGLKILLVEDVVDNQALMAHFLNLAGARVDVANNGNEGVAKALAGDFDAILMDIQMPVLDGYEATRQLRHQGYQAPIIALTAHALTEEREKSIEAGCNDHLSKPVEFNVLIDHLSKIVADKNNKGETRV